MLRWTLAALIFVLAACTPRPDFVLSNAEPAGALVPVFVATSRQPDGQGRFSNERTEVTRFGRYDVAIPPDRRLATVPHPNGAQVDPRTDFFLSEYQIFEDPGAFRADLSRALAQEVGADREAVIFVHGFNNTFTDSVYRTAQLRHDLRLPSVAISYSWPSAANPLGYAYDRDSVLFARDGLEQLIRETEAAGAREITLVAHSMGSLLLMETLRQMAIRDGGQPSVDISGVVLMSPDIDVDVFHAQSTALDVLPQPFAIFVSEKDRALTLSARLTGQWDRLGNLSDPTEIADLPITLLDITELSNTATMPHFAIGTSEVLTRLLARGGELDRAFRSDRAGRTGLLPGTVLTVQNVTQVILSPGLVQN